LLLLLLLRLLLLRLLRLRVDAGVRHRLLLLEGLPTAGAGLLELWLLQLLVRMLLLLGLATTWLLQGGGRASFPLADPLLHRRLLGLGGLVGRDVRGVRVGTWGVFVPLDRFVGVKAGGWARVRGFADAGTLAPAVSSGAPCRLE